MKGFIKRIKEFHTIQHFGLGMGTWAYVYHAFGTGWDFWIVATIVFWGIEIIQWLRRGKFFDSSLGMKWSDPSTWKRYPFFTLDTITDLIADYAGLMTGWLLWILIEWIKGLFL